MLAASRVPDDLTALAPADLLFFSHDVNRQCYIDGKAYDKYLNSIQELAEAMGLTACFMALPYSHLTGPRAAGEVASMNRRWLLTRALARVSASLGKRAGVYLYRNIIARVQPRAVFAIGTSPELASAARSLNVPIVEVLHAHGYTDSDSLGQWSRRFLAESPTHVLCFDATSFRAFSSVASDEMEVALARDPWLAKFPSLSENKDRLRDSHFEQDTSNQMIILVTLSWGYDGDYEWSKRFDDIYPNGFLPEDLIRVIDTSDTSTIWLVRAHPVQMRTHRRARTENFLNRLCEGKPNVTWVKATHEPLPKVLASCTHHITARSVAAYEAAHYSVPTLALCPTIQPGGEFAEELEDLVDAGWVTKTVSSENSIRLWLESATTPQERPFDPEMVGVEMFLGRLTTSAICTKSTQS